MVCLLLARSHQEFPFDTETMELAIDKIYT